MRRERLEPVAVAFERGADVELDGLDLVGEPPEDAPEAREKVVQPLRPVERQRDLASAQRERLEHPRKAEIVVGVVVGEEDLLEIHETHVALEELPLGPLGTVEEQLVAAPADERGGECALGRRRGSGRPEKDDVEVHGG